MKEIVPVGTRYVPVGPGTRLGSVHRLIGTRARDTIGEMALAVEMGTNAGDVGIHGGSARLIKFANACPARAFFALPRQGKAFAQPPAASLVPARLSTRASPGDTLAIVIDVLMEHRA